MTLLAHPHPLNVHPRPALRLLERPARVRRPPVARDLSAQASESVVRRLDGWLDARLQRLATWAEGHWPERRTDRVVRY